MFAANVRGRRGTPSRDWKVMLGLVKMFVRGMRWSWDGPGPAWEIRTCFVPLLILWASNCIVKQAIVNAGLTFAYEYGSGANTSPNWTSAKLAAAVALAPLLISSGTRLRYPE